MKDRFMSGFVAGMAANLPIIILDAVANRFNLSKVTFAHFVSILAYKNKVLDFWEVAFATLIQFLFAGLLGLGFNYLIVLVKEKYYYFKSIIYSTTIWFIIYSIDIIFKIEDMAKIDFPTAVIHCLLAFLWGFIMAWMLRRIGEKATTQI